MVQLECIEDGCTFKTQDLPFENAEKILNMHLDRVHPVNAPAVSMGVVAAPSFNAPASAVVNVNISFNESYYVFLTGFPPTMQSTQIMSLLTNAGCPGEVCLVETEAGKLTGEAVIRLATPGDRDCVLGYDYSKLFGVNIASKETNSNIFYKYAKKVAKEESGKNLYIRLKGMEWQKTEQDVRDFLSEADVERIIMTKTPTGRATGEAYVKLKTEADTEIAKKKNRQYLGRRFVVIEEVYEEQYNIADGGGPASPQKIARKIGPFEKETILLKNLPDNADQEGVVNFLMKKGECEVERVEEVNNAKHTARVKCRTEKDATRGVTCNNSTYNGNPITVEKIPLAV